MPIGIFQGRVMPFSRYLKAIYAGKQNNTTVLKKVIQRSISKSKPKPFEFIDYSNLTNIKKLLLSKLIKNHLKSDKSLEVEYMTLYEREKEKFLEGVEANKLANAKALLDILDDETIASKIELPLETVQKLRTEILSQ